MSCKPNVQHWSKVLSSLLGTSLFKTQRYFTYKFCGCTFLIPPVLPSLSNMMSLLHLYSLKAIFHLFLLPSPFLKWQTIWCCTLMYKSNHYGINLLILFSNFLKRTQFFSTSLLIPPSLIKCNYFFYKSSSPLFDYVINGLLFFTCNKKHQISIIPSW